MHPRASLPASPFSLPALRLSRTLSTSPCFSSPPLFLLVVRRSEACVRAIVIVQALCAGAAAAVASSSCSPLLVAPWTRISRPLPSRRRPPRRRSFVFVLVLLFVFVRIAAAAATAATAAAPRRLKSWSHLDSTVWRVGVRLVWARFEPPNGRQSARIRRTASRLPRVLVLHRSPSFFTFFHTGFLIRSFPSRARIEGYEKEVDRSSCKTTEIKRNRVSEITVKWMVREVFEPRSMALPERSNRNRLLYPQTDIDRTRKMLPMKEKV